ncbi:KN motif and ankyrin repeat domain-containing protein 2 [Harpia harpyja]|uniref:KN motif and ankyrin repeat domain-containing protein 2 n=1 Tax=Harpia harpyja TaxID=202280 RepID=UPI0022B11286|nr:KN motif and ankyrin repeat domain-containing protein 2 [Harpia harpyja]
MAQVLRAEAFPGRRSGPPPGAGDAPYSLETAYGYRLDLGFLGYVEAIEKGLTLRRVPVGRRPHRASWAASAETLGPPAAPDPRVERTLRGARRRLEEEGVPARVSPAAGVPATVGSPGAAPLRLVREQMAAALGRLRELEEQVRALPALRRRLERLQEEKRQLLDRLRRDGGCRCGCGCGCGGSVDGNGDPGGFGDDGSGIGVGTDVGSDDGTGTGTSSGAGSSVIGSVTGTSISSGIGSSNGTSSSVGSSTDTGSCSGTAVPIANASISTNIASGSTGSGISSGISSGNASNFGSITGTTVPMSTSGIGSGIATGSGTTVPVPIATAGPRGRRSVGVGTEGSGVPGGAGGLPGRVAVLERQLRRALGELREARARLAQRQPQPGDEEQQEEEEEEEERDEGHGRPRGGGSGRPGSSSSDESEYHEAVEGPPPRDPPNPAAPRPR